jgi:Serine dehydrogenase proteinase
MGNWNDIHEEIVAGEIKKQRESTSDLVRRNYLKALHSLTGRNTVAYYSGWLQRPGPEFAYITQITDEDKNGFMSCFKGWDWDKGLDLILHLPGGSVAATETIIDYVRSKFGDNIRTIVPQISMSGGTMLACAGKQIIMGLHSNLGPIDPQFGSWPAIAVLKEFDRAMQEVTQDPNKALLWQPIIAQYPPTLLSQAQHAIEWSREIARKTLREGMLKGRQDADAKADEIVEFLLSQDVHRAHGRHVHRKDLQDRGLNILELESDPALQDAVLSVHHAFIHALMNTNAVKIIEGHNAVALIRNVTMRLVQAPALQPTPLPQPPRPTPAPAQQAQPRPGLLARIFLAIRFIFTKPPQ